MGFSQEKLTQSISLQIDNDYFLPGEHDHYYTSGFFLHYHFYKNGFLFFKQEEKILLQTTLGQQLFTPENPLSSEVMDYDRPFAGWLFVKAAANRILKHDIFNVGLEVGVTGELSLSRQVQKGFHTIFNFKQAAWESQIPSEVMFNFSSSYKLRITDWFFSETSVMLGTKDIFIQQSVCFLANDNFNAFLEIPDKRKKIAPFTALRYRFVAYDVLIAGSIWNDNAPFTTAISHHLFLAEAGVRVQWNTLQWNVTYYYTTKQSRLARDHHYGGLNLSYLF